MLAEYDFFDIHGQRGLIVYFSVGVWRYLLVDKQLNSHASLVGRKLPVLGIGAQNLER